MAVHCGSVTARGLHHRWARLVSLLWCGRRGSQRRRAWRMGAAHYDVWYSCYIIFVGGLCLLWRGTYRAFAFVAHRAGGYFGNLLAARTDLHSSSLGATCMDRQLCNLVLLDCAYLWPCLCGWHMARMANARARPKVGAFAYWHGSTD